MKKCENLPRDISADTEESPNMFAKLLHILYMLKTDFQRSA